MNMKTLISKSFCLVLSLLLVFLCVGCDSQEEPAAVLTPDPVLDDSSYSLGDTMGDYTLTDVKGDTYSFSELLKDKKAIVLNFWFVNCGPCRIEFPYLEEAYVNYQNDIEVLAINCVDENASDVADFATENGLSFPVIAGDTAWEKTMSIQGYPTTVVIDRFGTISMIHTGYIDSTETFEHIFEFFANDEYTPTLVKNLSDIK